MLFRITTTTSVFTDATNDDAFDSDTAGADTLIVDPGAFLIATGPGNSSAARLANTGAWTVAINGSLFSRVPSLVLEAGNSAVSTISIGSSGHVGLVVVNSAAIIKNAGFIEETSLAGLDFSGTDTHTITNSGTISGIRSINSGGSSVEKLTNYGTLIGGVDLGGANDVFTNFKIVGGVKKSGIVLGTIGLGSGNDQFNGGSKNETVKDGDNADKIKLGSGSDSYIAIGATSIDGNDSIDGGKGVDLYDASDAVAPVLINLDSVLHHRGPFNPGEDALAAHQAIGAVSGTTDGTVQDTVIGFEDAFGGSAADTIYGSKIANVLAGGGGNDNLFGYGGADTLSGGGGTDVLDGGTGKDFLSGGFQSGELDYFGFTSLAGANGDVIEDFEDGVDQIHLFHIDANTKNAAGTNDAFHFIGTNVNWDNSGPGQLRAYWAATGQILEGDVNGDKKADFSIEVVDSVHGISFGADDFVL